MLSSTQIKEKSLVIDTLYYKTSGYHDCNIVYYLALCISDHMREKKLIRDS